MSIPDKIRARAAEIKAAKTIEIMKQIDGLYRDTVDIMVETGIMRRSISFSHAGADREKLISHFRKLAEADGLKAILVEASVYDEDTDTVFILCVPE